MDAKPTKDLRYRRAFSSLLATRSKPSWIDLDWIEERRDNKRAWVAVTLSLNGEQVTGLSPAQSWKRCRHGVLRTAIATLRAIEIFFDHRLACELADVEQVRALGTSFVLVRVRLDLDGESAELFGSARVEGDPMRAAADAVLDATNVYIDSLLSSFD